MNAEKLAFVDRYLAKKNIEPYDKIFLRHILLKYGRLDSKLERIEFRSEWLSQQSRSFSGTGIRKSPYPMWIKLDKTILRGCYLSSGGAVYVEDVDREVDYATGEEYNYNIAAFKSFLYRLSHPAMLSL